MSIGNFREILSYVKSDYVRYGNKAKIQKILISVLLNKNHCFSYSFWLRFSSKKNLFFPIAKIMHNRLSKKYGLQIPRSTKIGYGLYIGHGIGIVINETTIIGNNCNLSQFTTIGANHGQSAIIGDNVFIGPSVCIVEDVKIGNNVTIGAGSVVIKDAPENSTVAGVPAKVISYKTPGRYIGNKFDLTLNNIK